MPLIIQATRDQAPQSEQPSDGTVAAVSGLGRATRIGLYLMFGLVGCFDSNPPSADTVVTSRDRISAAVAEIPTLTTVPLGLADVTSGSGIVATYSSGRSLTILETVGGGVALSDLDQDGRLDVLIPGGGTIDLSSQTASGAPISFFRNLGDFRFEAVPHQQAFDRLPNYSHGCITPDLNNDGFPDIVLTCFGDDLILINHGDGTFAAQTLAAATRAERWSTAAAAFDAENDGDLDLFVARYLDWSVHGDACVNPVTRNPDVCTPQSYAPGRDALFTNNDLSFHDGNSLPESAGQGRGLGVMAVDLDENGQSELYVANDGGPNHLYRKSATGMFEESALWAGVSGNEFGAFEGSMGIDAGDVNGDGICDLWVTNFEYEDNSLYLGRNELLFEHATIPMNLSGPARLFVGFGTRLLDLDLDSWLDILVVNGHVYYDGNAAGYAQPPLAWRNESGRQFTQWSADNLWIQSPHPSRGLAAGDLDNDGAADVVIVNQNEPATVLHNRLTTNWTSIRLIGTTSNRDAIGAVFTAQSEAGVVKRWVTSGAGYLSQSDSRITLPVGWAGPDVAVTVQWPGGARERFTGLQDGQLNALIQGTGSQ